MTIKECYDTFGGDYAGVIGRLGKEERVQKYALKFATGNDYKLIVDSLEAGNKEEAFRNVHNLKGVALNLGITPLHETADVLRDRLSWYISESHFLMQDEISVVSPSVIE